MKVLVKKKCHHRPSLQEVQEVRNHQDSIKRQNLIRLQSLQNHRKYHYNLLISLLTKKKKKNKKL